MKNLKKLSGILLAIAVLLACTVSAFALTGTNDNSGKITINGAKKDHTYTIYQILSLESYDTTESRPAYSYRLAGETNRNPETSKWYNFVKTGDGKDFLEIDQNGYVTWKSGVNAEVDSVVADFAKKALEYAKTASNGVAKAGTNTPSVDGPIEFTPLNLGYYLVDSTAGALCSLDTTRTEATVNEKNNLPTVTKKVKEGASFETTNTAKIGDVVEFQITIEAKKGAENYVLHDKMEAGLTLDEDSIKVWVGDSQLENTSNANYEIKTTGLSHAECDFEIVFTKTYLDSVSNGLADINAKQDIVVTYSATLNENAEIFDQTNDNTAYLAYGTDEKTAESTTTTKTFQFELVKTDMESILLDGAKFKLYDSETNGTEIPVVKLGDGSYRVAVAGESGAEIEAGKVIIKGLDANKYYLEETKAPEGYNKLPAREPVDLTSGNNLMATMDNVNDQLYKAGGIQVKNNKGSLLPSTGGIGTTIFYIVGGVLVAAAVVLLVAKKRTSENR